MAGVDSLLRMLSQYNADELRLGTDEAPRMLQRGSPVRLSIPPTNDMMLRHLVEGILTREREAELMNEGRVDAPYKAENGDSFVVSFARSASGFTAQFRRGAS